MVQTEIYLPAYTDTDQGILLELTLTFKPSQQPLAIHPTGILAEALAPQFKRMLFIFTMVFASTYRLMNGSYSLKSKQNNVNVMQTQSSGLGIILGLFSIARQLNHASIPTGVAASGSIIAPGYVGKVSGISQKKMAILHSQYSLIKLLSYQDIKHISELTQVLEKYLS